MSAFLTRSWLLIFCIGFSGYASLATAASSLDSDNDGVADAVDKCPHTTQIQKIDKNLRIAAIFPPAYTATQSQSVAVDSEGCALDTDKDGVADHLDFCPQDTPIEISAGVSSNGCPRQSDGDGTPDYRDQCPDTPKGVSANQFGCPA